MWRSREKRIILTLIHEEEIHFLLLERDGGSRVLESRSLQQFLDAETGPATVSDAKSNWDDNVLLIPDYWIGNASYNFLSKKRSLTEAFIERKLHAEHPDLPDISNFYEYTFYRTDRDRQGVRVYFIQETDRDSGARAQAGR